MAKIEAAVLSGKMDHRDSEQNILIDKNKRQAWQSTPAEQIGLVFIVLFGQFCALCLDTFIFPFFPVIATKKGLTEFHFGLVYSAYEFARFITCPVYGSLVRDNKIVGHNNIYLLSTS